MVTPASTSSLGRFSDGVHVRLVQSRIGFACLGDHDGSALGAGREIAALIQLDRRAGLKRAGDSRRRFPVVEPQAVFQRAATLQLKYALVVDPGGAGCGIETFRAHRAAVGLRIGGLRAHIDPAAAVGGIAVDVTSGLAQDTSALQAPAGIRLVVPDRGGSSHDDLIKSIC